jgi:sugar phosphate isomerase/epimerase
MAPPPRDVAPAPSPCIEFSLAHLTVIGATPIEQIEIAATAGYDYVGLRVTPVVPGELVTPLADDPRMRRQLASRLAGAGVQVLDVELARLGPDEPPEDYLDLLDTAASIGARHVVGQLRDPDRHRATDQFGRLCDLAAGFGVTVELEFPSWMETGTLAAAATIVGDVGRDNAGILVDALHFYRSDSRPEDLDALPARWFRFVQLCDAPASAPASVDGVVRTARAGRSLPGYGGLPLRALLEHLPIVPYSLEVPNDVLRQELGAADYARLVLATARELVAEPRSMALTR